MMGEPATKREIVLVAIAVLFIALVYRNAWIPSDPQAALDRAAEVWEMPVEGAGRWFSAWTIGDGQAFAVIAADPLGVDEGWRVSQPAYRYSRVALGWAAWAVSLGQERFIPYALAIVGFAAVAGTFLLSVRMRRQLGVKAWLLVLNPAVFIGLAGDTAEALAVLTLGWAMASGAAWSAAVLGITRPSYLVALVGRWRLLAWGSAVAAAFSVAWMARFGFNLSQYGGRLGLPFMGYIEAPTINSLLLVAAALITLALGLRARDFGWIASGLFVICLTAHVVERGANGWRAAGMLFVLWAFGPGFKPAEDLSASRSY